jgi:hypothetical protein
MTDTATVETLTAEVRTLMVDIRQVTTSVYRQLDIVPPNAIEPFGRVRSGETFKDAAGDEVSVVEVVGRVAQGFPGAGALARSRVEADAYYPYDNERQRRAEAVCAEWSRLPSIVLADLR